MAVKTKAPAKKSPAEEGGEDRSQAGRQEQARRQA